MRYEKELGVYKIKVPGSDLQPFDVYCTPGEHYNTTWTVIQRRRDGSVDFFRNWTSYELGFGNPDGEHFLGLEKIHALTNSQPYTLRIDLRDRARNSYLAEYSRFSIGDANQKYILRLGTFLNSGGAGDSMKEQNLTKFSTFDSDNDETPDRNCAAEYRSGWWFKECSPDLIGR